MEDIFFKASSQMCTWNVLKDRQINNHLFTIPIKIICDILTDIGVYWRMLQREQ